MRCAGTAERFFSRSCQGSNISVYTPEATDAFGRSHISDSDSGWPCGDLSFCVTRETLHIVGTLMRLLICATSILVAESCPQYMSLTDISFLNAFTLGSICSQTGTDYDYSHSRTLHRCGLGTIQQSELRNLELLPPLKHSLRPPRSN